MEILAVIPARAGSERLPRKNRLEIEPGLSLVQQAINCAVDSGIINHTCVITDDNYLQFERATRIREPPELAGPSADIAAAAQYALNDMDPLSQRGFDYVVTLQPAVLARSPLIVRRLVEYVLANAAGGGVTTAHTVPWQWSVRGPHALNSWYPGSYPRSQHAGTHLCEINGIQVASRAAVINKRRWDLPLVLAELPPWAASLDIDHPEDMARARDIWSFARPRLETCVPPMHLVKSINREGM